MREGGDGALLDDAQRRQSDCRVRTITTTTATITAVVAEHEQQHLRRLLRALAVQQQLEARR